MNLTVSQISLWVNGKVPGDSLRKIKGVCTNSKAVKSGDLFIALKGEKFDAHDFIDEAVKRKAAAVLVSRRPRRPVKIPVIFVKDTTLALGLLAKHYRAQFDIPVIAITGSAGKTTTKEITAAVLSAKYRVLKSPSSWNNRIGLPLTLLQLRRRHQAAVLEIGTNQPGDIRTLTEIARPTIAILTTVGPSHLQGLKSEEEVFREKTDLLRFMPKGDVIVNADNPDLARIPGRFRRHRVCTYGTDAAADFRADDIRFSRGRWRFSVGGHKMAVGSPVRSDVSNALAAISCGRLLNVSYNDIYKYIGKFKQPPGRQNLCRRGTVLILDDTYNANPVSVKSALETLRDLPLRGRRIFVFADMLELGRRAPVLHKAVGRDAAAAGVDIFYTLGDQARFAAETFAGRGEARHFSSRQKLHQRLKQVTGPRDGILVKGSRGMGMEQTVEFLKKTVTGR